MRQISKFPPNFIPIRFKTTEPGFLQRSPRPNDKNNKMSSDRRSVPGLNKLCQSRTSLCVYQSHPVKNIDRQICTPNAEKHEKYDHPFEAIHCAANRLVTRSARRSLTLNYKRTIIMNTVNVASLKLSLRLINQSINQ